MLLKKIELIACSIPFRFSYGHALATHRGVESVLCLMYDDKGNCGVGESVPRRYVTGETVASVMNCAEVLLRKCISGSSDTEDIATQFEKVIEGVGQPFPSCAVNCIDGALMTLHACQEGKPLYELLGAKKAVPLQYYGSIGIGSTLALLPKLLFYKLYGFKHFKIKVATSADIERIGMVKRVLGSGVSLFADANCAWNFKTAVENAFRLYRAGVWALEEPLTVGKGHEGAFGQIDREALLDTKHYELYHKLKLEVPIPLIADESLISPESMKKIIEYDAFSIANIRLSKCGGTQVCSTLYRQASAAGMSVGLGAMVGESPFLATIGSHFGVAHPDHRYIQGHAHHVLHRIRIGTGEPMMERGGGMHISSSVHGTGVTVCREALQQVKREVRTISL